MKLADLAGRRVAVLGMGREGQAAAERLRAQSPVSITLLDEQPFVAPDWGSAVRTGSLAELALDSFDVIIRSPGVSVYRPELRHAAEAGVHITSGTSLWLNEPPPAPVLAVTGTKGKSTTASLLAHLLEAAGRRVALAGNIGVPVLALPAQPVPDYYVLELSSYQIVDLTGQVSWALLTNLLRDHLDWHGGVEPYQQDKLRLLSRTTVGAVLPADLALPEGLEVAVPVVSFGGDDGWRVTADGVFFGPEQRAGPVDWPLLGTHNLRNLSGALALLAALEEPTVEVLDSLQQFRGLPHRLERVGAGAGVTCIDDSISTTPDATRAAIEAIPAGALILILGGTDRRQRWQELAAYLNRCAVDRPLTVVAQGETGGAVASAFAEHAPSVRLVEAAGVTAATRKALKLAGRGSTILLSPGAPSFDQFSTFVERGECFARVCREALGLD
ncbi:MAG: UDP-N-acetylmuramoyl-L-alanine--D-glutamate ligase [Pseudomonadota bacterium]